MALPIFNPPVGPTFPHGYDIVPRVRTIQYGDGYKQAAPDGLNYLDREVSLGWENLTASEANQIVAFFEERGGYQPFSYTLDGETLTYLCSTWNKERTSPNSYNVSATFERSYLA